MNGTVGCEIIAELVADVPGGVQPVKNCYWRICNDYTATVKAYLDILPQDKVS